MSDLLLRYETRESVRSCTACSLHSSCNAPVPFDGPAPCRIAVIGEAPGASEDREGRPFVGPSGSLARMWVDAAIGEPVAWLNVVSCFPNRTPTTKEVESCRVNLRSQLAVIQPTFLLLFGGVAVSAFISDMRIGKVAGSWWQVNDSELNHPWALATWHPAAVLRNRELEKEVITDLSVFRDVVVDGLEPWRSRYCIECGSSEGVTWTANQIPYCRKHREWKEGTAGRGRTTSRTSAPKHRLNKRNQTKLM